MDHIGKRVYIKVTERHFDNEGIIAWIQDDKLKDLQDLYIFETTIERYQPAKVVAYKEDRYGNDGKFVVQFEDDGSTLSYSKEDLFFAEPAEAAADGE
jgi:hypothetical protein